MASGAGGKYQDGTVWPECVVMVAPAPVQALGVAELTEDFPIEEFMARLNCI